MLAIYFKIMYSYGWYNLRKRIYQYMFKRKPYVGLSDKIRNQKNSQQILLESSSWLTIGNIVSRLLGALYIIPWGIWMGADRDNANYLYFIAYNIYALVLQISTAGIPVAISKIVADNQARRDYKTSWRLFKGTMLFMTFLGFVFAAGMYFAAPLFAKGVTPEEVADSIMVIRSLTPAVLIIPPLSLMRGYYQGYNEMAASAKSQLWEQVVRILYMLGLTYFVMRVVSGGYVLAVAHSTFAAFVGAVIAFLYLAYKMFRDHKGMMELMEEGRPERPLSFWKIIFEVMREALPFVLVTSSIQIISLIDQETFQRFVPIFTTYSFEEGKELITLFGFNANKIIMIVISLAMSISTAALPLLAAHYSVNDREEVKRVIANNLGLFAYIMIPASVGMAIVSEPIYNVFYSPDPTGTYLLIVSCVMCVFLGLFVTFTYILQSMEQHIIAIKALGFTVIIKLLWQPMMMYFLGGAGPLIASSVAFFAATLYMCRHVLRLTRFDLNYVLKKFCQVLLVSFAMAVTSAITLFAIKQVMPIGGKVRALIAVAVVGLVGVTTYGLITLKNRLADEMLGARVGSIRRKLRMK